MYDWKWSNEMADIRQISDFDDRAENVQGAIDFGMRAKRVLSAKELAADLEELLRLE